MYELSAGAEKFEILQQFSFCDKLFNVQPGDAPHFEAATYVDEDVKSEQHRITDTLQSDLAQTDLVWSKRLSKVPRLLCRADTPSGVPIAPSHIFKPARLKF